MRPGGEARRSAASEPDHAGAGSLARLGLARGDQVRFKVASRARAQTGTVLRLETDGSVAVRDQNDRWRAIPPASIEVRVVGPRGGIEWVALSDAGEGNQLGLF